MKHACFLIILSLQSFGKLSCRSTESSRDFLTITVKSTEDYHNTRLRDIADTWLTFAPHNTYIISDKDDAYVNKTFNGHLINSGCGTGHHRKALCCKMASELHLFKQKNSKWSCHFDDDNYVNVPQLKTVLHTFDSTKDGYIGKQSTGNIKVPGETSTFRFATGGAGICLSRSLVEKVSNFLARKSFIDLCDEAQFPDDMTLGYLIDHLLRVPLVELSSLHSHLEALQHWPVSSIPQQISLSGLPTEPLHSLNLPSSSEDPLKFREIHRRVRRRLHKGSK